MVVISVGWTGGTTELRPARRRAREPGRKHRETRKKARIYNVRREAKAARTRKDITRKHTSIGKILLRKPRES